ncbi:MAG: alanine racemase [Sporichthyaceae bacterium]
MSSHERAPAVQPDADQPAADRGGVPAGRPAAGRACAHVDLAAIRANAAALRGHAPGAALMAVVKADGYGHGMIPVARAALDGGATWLGVAVLEEALALREAGIGARILCWLIAPGEDVRPALAAEVDLSANAPWAVTQIAAAAAELGVVARLHLKVDTGLGRGGASAGEWPGLLECAAAAQRAGHIRIVGLWSHLACSDEPSHPSVAAQLESFRGALALAERAGITAEVRHLANSAATLTLPETHFDLVRAGIAVYGYSPVPALGDSAAYGLRPAMTLTARLALTKRVPAGHGVSYGHTYVTSAESTLGVVPVGYADGIPRSASGRGPMQVRGERVHIAGRVCMDQVMLDLGDRDAAAGDEVVLFGPGEHGEPTVQEWADTLGTISYEIVTGIGARIPRVHT